MRALSLLSAIFACLLAASLASAHIAVQMDKPSQGQTYISKASFEEWAIAMYEVAIDDVPSYDGVGPRVMKLVADDLGIGFVIYTGYSWDVVIKMVIDNLLDWSFCYKTQERIDAGMKYSVEVMNETVSVFGNESCKLAKLDDLRGARVVKVTGNSLGNATDNYLKENATLVEAKDLDAAFQMMAGGDAQYLVHSQIAGQLYMAEHNIVGTAELLQLNGEGLYIAIGPNSPLLKYLPAINAIIERMKASGEIDQITKDVIRDYKKLHSIP